MTAFLHRTQFPDLFTEPSPVDPVVKRPRRNTSDTQVQADVANLETGRYAQKQRIVVDTLRAYGRLTRDEIASLAGMKLCSVCSTVRALISASSSSP